MKKLIAGNWKMNGDLASAKSLTQEIVNGLNANVLETCDFVVCPPALQIAAVQEIAANTALAVGAQNCSDQDKGAFTGEISAPMVKDAGCDYVILGHSERRQYFAESDTLIKDKAVKAYAAGLAAIICVGETESEREAGKEQDIVGIQLSKVLGEGATAENTVIAYEPVWAIGTGKTATPDDVAAMHDFIRRFLSEKLADSERVRILYGGSVKPANAQELLSLENVNGALIGGASLKAEDFLGIANAAPQLKAQNAA